MSAMLKSIRRDPQYLLTLPTLKTETVESVVIELKLVEVDAKYWLCTQAPARPSLGDAAVGRVMRESTIANELGECECTWYGDENCQQQKGIARGAELETISEEGVLNAEAVRNELQRVLNTRGLSVDVSDGLPFS